MPRSVSPASLSEFARHAFRRAWRYICDAMDGVENRLAEEGAQPTPRDLTIHKRFMDLARIINADPVLAEELSADLDRKAPRVSVSRADTAAHPTPAARLPVPLPAPALYSRPVIASQAHIPTRAADKPLVPASSKKLNGAARKKERARRHAELMAHRDAERRAKRDARRAARDTAVGQSSPAATGSS